MQSDYISNIFYNARVNRGKIYRYYFKKEQDYKDISHNSTFLCFFINVGFNVFSSVLSIWQESALLR